MTSPIGNAQVIDYCSENFALRICDLDGSTLTHEFVSGTGESATLDIQVQSCKWQDNKEVCHKSNFLAYLVAIVGENNGTHFLLTGPGGAKLPVSISFTDATNFTTVIAAIGSEQELNGTNALLPAGITATVDPLATQGLLPGNYSAEFILSARQTGGCGKYGCTEFSDIGFTINIALPAQIVVKRMDDIPLSRPAGNSQAISQREDICVGGTGFSQYKVTFFSQNGSTGAGGGAYPFQLNGSNTTDTLPYYVAFTGNTAAPSGTSAASDGSVSGTFSRTGDLACSGDNATIFISIPASDWNAAIDTHYTDTLSITVAPE